MTRASLRSFLCRSLLAATLVCAVSASTASAEERGTGWELTARSSPTVFSPTPAESPSVSGTISIDIFNVGAADSSGTITVTDTLPPGIRAVDAGALEEAVSKGTRPVIGHSYWLCTGDGEGAPPSLEGASVITCTNDPEKLASFAGGGGAPTPNPVVQGHPQPVIGIAVDVQPGAEAHETNHVTISGGGAAAPTATADAVVVGNNPSSAELAGWDGWFSNEDGTIDTQAGSHPYEWTLNFNLATILHRNPAGEVTGERISGGEPRNVTVELPPGVLGNPAAVPQCTRSQFDAEKCPDETIIGTGMFFFAFLSPDGLPIYNLKPPPGVPAEFGFNLSNVTTFVDAHVRSGSDYGVTAHVNNIAQREVVQAVTTFWGNPGDPTHRKWRNGQPGGCSPAQEETGTSEGVCGQLAHPFQTPFLTLPTRCTEPEPHFVIKVTTWTGNTTEKSFALHDERGAADSWTGCELLGFEPLIKTTPETAQTDAPTGLKAEVKPAIGGLEQPTGLGSADIADATVVLPPGFVVNPGQAAGLQACKPGDVPSGDDLPLPGEDGSQERFDGPADCPAASKVGTVLVRSPLLESAPEKQLEGDVYLVESNPPEVKILAAASGDGVNVKLLGVVSLCESQGQVVDGQTCQAPGQLITRFQGTPELPASLFNLSFEGGARAALDTPTQCGIYVTHADFTPWSGPFTEDFNTTSAMSVSEGLGGSVCPPSVLPFEPSMTAGSTSGQAAALTGFSLLLQRGDGQQRLEQFQFTEPRGLAGLISQVPLCPEPQASEGTCDAASRVGHAVVQSGPGPNPLTLPQAGGPELPIYLTGPYKGAPFGLSIATPIVAGPFNLGTIIDRAKIDVNPTTAQITVTTDPLPQVVRGVPTNIRSIYSVVDRPNFLFNPTNCNPQEYTGTATSAGGVSTVPIASRFQVAGCRELTFQPHFTASASGKTSKANGASLRVKITYPGGGQANISRVDVTIPAILPTRLTTIQKACTEAQFNTNPAGCPAGSIIASAVVRTPVFKNPLMGPVYFVSHGNAAFPDVEMILQGEGVTLIVDGKTQIKKGVTFSHFETVPDEPFSSFEFNAPQGPHSIFTANGDLCASAVKMPTTLTAQNGAVIKQSTPVAVEGCPDTLRVLMHSVKHGTLTLKVVVPSAGRLTVTGNGIAKHIKAAAGRSTLTLTVKPRKHQKLKSRVKLSFVRTHGSRLRATVVARFKR